MMCSWQGNSGTAFAPHLGGGDNGEGGGGLETGGDGDGGGLAALGGGGLAAEGGGGLAAEGGGGLAAAGGGGLAVAAGEGGGDAAGGMASVAKVAGVDGALLEGVPPGLVATTCAWKGWQGMVLSVSSGRWHVRLH